MTDARTLNRRGGRARSALSFAFGLLAIIGVLSSVIAVWANRVLFEPTSVSTAVDRALLEPEVTDALAVYLTNQILDAVEIDTLVQDKLPPALTDLSPVLVGGVRTIVHDALDRVLSEEATRRVLVGAAEQSHRAIMRVLEGGSLLDGVTNGDGAVSVNLLPIIGRGFETLQEAGLLARVELPDLPRRGDPSEQIAALEEAIGRPLPADFGQLEVYRSDQLAAAGQKIARAQQALVVFRQAILVILGFTIVALIASALLAHRRRRAVLMLLLGVVGAMAVGRALVRMIVSEVPTLAIQPGARAALSSMVSSLAGGLLTSVTLMLLLSVVLAAMAFLSGPSGPANALRGRASSSGSSVGSILSANRDATAIGAFALAVLVISVAGFSLAALLLALAFAAVGAAALLMPHPAAPADPPPVSPS